MPGDLERIALWWGPGVLILIVFGYGGLRLAHYWIEKSMEVKRQQMDSAFGIARQYVEQFLGTQRSQADALSRLASCVEQHDSHESFEHQEMLIALKALHRDIADLPCRAMTLAEPPRGAGEGSKQKAAAWHAGPEGRQNPARGVSRGESRQPMKQPVQRDPVERNHPRREEREPCGLPESHG